MHSPAPELNPDAPAFYETYHDRIYRHILGMVHDPSEAEDLTQESLLRAFVKRDSLRQAEAGLAWLYRIATHISLDRLRQRSRLAPLQSDADPAEIDLADPALPSVSRTVERGEMSECVQGYLAELPDNYRTVIMLQDMHGLTGPEIADTLGLSLATVKIRLHRARRMLRHRLEGGCSFSRDEEDVLVCERKC